MSKSVSSDGFQKSAFADAIYPGVAQAVAYTGTAAQSSAFAATTNLVRVVSTTNAYIKFGSNPTATSADIYMVAAVPAFFGVTPGDKVSALQVASAGTLSVVEAA